MKTKSQTEVSNLQTAMDLLRMAKTRLFEAGEPALALVASSLISKAACAAAGAVRGKEARS